MRFQYFLSSNSGLGHAARASAIINASIDGLAGDVQWDIWAHQNAIEFLRYQMKPHPSVRFNELVYLQYDSEREKWVNIQSIREFMQANRTFDTKSSTEIVISDRLDAALNYADLLSDSSGKRSLKIGIYHSDFYGEGDHDPEIQHFKRKTIGFADKTDVFILVTPYLVNWESFTNSMVIQVPLIVRQPCAIYEPSLLHLESPRKLILVYYGFDSEHRHYPARNRLVSLLEQIASSHNVIYATSSGAYLLTNGHIRRVDTKMTMCGQNLVQAADLIITKPGMSILSEIIYFAKPYILLPPISAEQRLKVSMMQRLSGIQQQVCDIDNLSSAELLFRIDQAINAFKNTSWPVKFGGEHAIAKMFSQFESIYATCPTLDRSVILDRFRDISHEAWRN